MPAPPPRLRGYTGATFRRNRHGRPRTPPELSSTFGASLNSIGQRFAPTETIQTGQARRYLKYGSWRGEYSFSRRSAFTYEGSMESCISLSESHQQPSISGSRLSLSTEPEKSIAVLASYDKIDNTGAAISTQAYGGALAFGRKITERLAFQAEPVSRFSCRTASGNFQIWTRRSKAP